MGRKSYSAQQKAKAVVQVLRERQTTNQLAGELGVHPVMLTQWKKKALEGLPTLFERKGTARHEAQGSELVDRLYQQIGRLQVEVDFLKKKFGMVD